MERDRGRGEGEGRVLILGSVKICMWIWQWVSTQMGSHGAERVVERCMTKVHNYLRENPPGKSIDYTHLAYL